MANVLANLARMTTATTGTGTITLTAAATGFISFESAGVNNADVVTYCIEDGNEREIGQGTYTTSGTTLSRDTVYDSTNSGAKITLSGTAEVFITASAEDLETRADISGTPTNNQVAVFTDANTIEGDSGLTFDGTDLTITGDLICTNIQPTAWDANISAPGGRLTVTTGEPELYTQASTTNIYYTPATSDVIPIYNGTRWIFYSFSELTNDLTDNTVNPAAVTTNTAYDMFVWNDSGTLRLGRGPAWSSATSRGTGAGTTELTRQNGRLVNANDITNGATANRGTYVGTVLTNGSSVVQWRYNTSGTGGDQTVWLGVWNLYNRQQVNAIFRDTTSSYTLASVSSYRQFNNSTDNRVVLVDGSAGQSLGFTFTGTSATGSGGSADRHVISIGIDGTTADTNIGPQYSIATASTTGPWGTNGAVIPGLGVHSIYPLERQPGANNATAFPNDTRFSFTWLA